jgi:hypothetical protein
MGNEILRTIGIIRAKFQMGMRNLVYNRSRLVSLKRAKVTVYFNFLLVLQGLLSKGNL